MTKVYSLICNDFVIYDSRVAAALGSAVVKFCVANKESQVPEALQFPWASAKEGPNQNAPKRRNPSCGSLVFPRLRSGSAHAQWNLKANWLLKAVLNHANAEASKFNEPTESAVPLRKLEAALFMIGYDLTQPSSSTSDFDAATEVAVTSQASGSASDGNNWNDCQTLGRGNCFRYRIGPTAIEVENDVSFNDDAVSELLTILWKQFHEQPFPLANSATKVRAGASAMGLGKAYFEVTKKNPPDTSKLAAVLEEVGAIIPLHIPQKRGMQWKINVDLFGEPAPSDCLKIRPLLDNLLRREEEL